MRKNNFKFNSLALAILARARGLLMVLLMLCTTAGYAEEIRPKYVSHETNGKSGDHEQAQFLVDNEEPGRYTKWFVYQFKSANIVVDAGKKIQLGKIKLRNGNDTKMYPARRWKEFKVFGSDDKTTWNELRHFQNQDMTTENNAYDEFFVGSKKLYQYYKVDVIAPASGTCFQMGDMLFVTDVRPTVRYDDEEIRPIYHDAAYYNFGSFSEDNNLPWKLVDEEGTKTSWGPGSKSTDPQIVVVDAQHPCRLHNLKLYAPATPSASGEKLSIAVYGSNDPTDAQHGDWHKLFGKENEAWNTNASVAYTAVINSNTEYRYYKIEKLASNTVKLISDLKMDVERNLNYPTTYTSFTPVYVSGTSGKVSGTTSLAINKGAEATDGKLNTFWTAYPDNYIVVDARQSIKLYGFELYNNNNSEMFHGRQWKDYALYGSDSPTKGWELIRSYADRYLYTKNGAMGAMNVVNSNKAYRYYKLVFLKSVQDEYGLLSELKLVRDNGDGMNGSVVPMPKLMIPRNPMTPNTHRLNANEIMVVDRDITINGTTWYAPLTVADNCVTVIEIMAGKTLTLNSASNSRYPGLLIPSSSIVLVRGDGKLVAKGGSGVAADNGANGTDGWYDSGKNEMVTGKGGAGGKGGTGAAAGIGGIAGDGGSGGPQTGFRTTTDWCGWIHKGGNGNNGYNGTASGNLIVMENVTVESTTGVAPNRNASGGRVGGHHQALDQSGDERFSSGGGGGGAGGQGSMPYYTICAGGGGGGGGGASGYGGYAEKRYSADTHRKEINEYFKKLNASRGGAGGWGSTNGQNGESQRMKRDYTSGDDWKKNGWNDQIVESTYDISVNLGGSRGYNGSDGKVYRFGASKLAAGPVGTKNLNNVTNEPGLATLKSLITNKNKYIYTLVTNTITLSPTRGSVFIDGDTKAELGTTITFYCGMPITRKLMVSIPTGEGDFTGFYFTYEGKSMKAFASDGSITADFRDLLMTQNNGVNCINNYLRNSISLHPEFDGETVITVNHYLKNEDSGTNTLLRSMTRTDVVKNSETVDYQVGPYVTLVKPGEIPDTLVCDGMRLTVEAFQTDAQTVTKTLGLNNPHETVDIYYTTIGMKYTLDDSELSKYGASFYGDYRRTTGKIPMGTANTLPYVAFRQPGTDGCYYRLAGWQSSAQVETLDENTRTYTMPTQATTLKPLFEKTGMVAIAAKKKATEDDQRNWADSCSVLLHPDNTLYNNSTIAMSTEESFDKIYVNVYYPTGARLKTLSAMMNKIEGNSDERNIKLENADKANEEDKCYFQKPTDWTKGEGETFPVVYVTAVFEEDRKAAKVRYEGGNSQGVRRRVGAPDVPVVALSTDGMNFYYDDSAFDILTEKDGCAKAGSLDDFDFGYEDQVMVYISNADNLDDVSIIATPDNVTLPADDNSAWMLQNMSTEPMTCLMFKAKTYDDVTITIRTGGDATGVEQIEAEDSADSIIYDLNGRRVGHMRKGAVVIENGKKHLVR